MCFATWCQTGGRQLTDSVLVLDFVIDVERDHDQICQHVVNGGVDLGKEKEKEKLREFWDNEERTSFNLWNSWLEGRAK